jgi:hypothetical protein
MIGSMKKLLFLTVLFLSTLLAQAATLKDKLVTGQVGDYIVTEQGKHTSVLLIRALSPSSVTLEEITIPSHEIKAEQNWKAWVQKKAPGHTSWTAYEINLADHTLKEVYSYTKRGWLFADEQEYFLAKLLGLPLKKTAPSDRRRIGPKPARGEEDHRAIWVPAVVIEGKKQEHPHVESLQTRWYKDQSELSECDVELYFDASHPEFPFPHWIEVKGEHYTLKVRSIDSGSGLTSPLLPMPYRPPEFIGNAQKTEDGLQLKLRSPSYYKQFHLYAIDLTSPAKESIPIPHKLARLNQKEEIALQISQQTLSSLLQDQHRYRWIAIPADTRDILAETEDPFLWSSSPPSK